MEAANSTKENFLDMLFPPISSIFLSWLYTAIDHITCIHIACRIETASIDPGGTLSVAYREPGGTAAKRHQTHKRSSLRACRDSEVSWQIRHVSEGQPTLQPRCSSNRRRGNYKISIP